MGNQLCAHTKSLSQKDKELLEDKDKSLNSQIKNFIQ
jgi:hypothetical protein